MIPSYSIIVKPTHMCNFNCKYCYDAEARRMYGTKQMELSDIERILSMFPDPCNIEWIWHGGEPTMMPAEFYEAAQDLFKQHPHLKIHQGMQSNGYNVSDKLLEVVEKYQIGMGISFDGLYQDIRKEGSTAVIRKNVQRMRDHGMTPGCICVVTPDNIANLRENFKFITEDMNLSVSFNPIFFSNEAVRTGIDTELYKYMDRLFDYYNFAWHEYTGTLEERSSVEILHALFCTGIVSCHLKDCRFQWIGIDPNGKIFPCDKTLSGSYDMGSIYDEGITVSKVFNSSGYRLYVAETDYRFTHDCAHCGYWDMCNGLCNSVVFAKWGRFDKIIPEECQKFMLEADYAFDHFSETDIYSVYCSPVLTHQLTSMDMYTPHEIIDFINSMGQDVEYMRDKSIPLTESRQYKLFRIFNPRTFQEGCCYSRLNVGYLAGGATDPNRKLGTMKDYRGIRLSVIRGIYEKHKEEILSLCK